MGNFNFEKVWWGAIPIGGGGQLPPCPYGSYGLVRLPNTVIKNQF